MPDTGNGSEPETTFVLVRGVNIPLSQVREREEEFEAKLVPDEEAFLIRALDTAYKEYRARTGRYPEFVTITKIDPFVEFVPYPISVFVPIAGPLKVTHKPAWFRRKRIIAMR